MDLPRNSRKPISAASWVISLRNVIEDFRMLVSHRIDEADTAHAVVISLLVD
jgi:hypothetical protein